MGPSASYTARAVSQDVCVDHRRRHVAVAEAIRASSSCMTCSEPCVAVNADNREVIELAELVSLVPFAEKHFLAVVTPGLQVIRVI